MHVEMILKVRIRTSIIIVVLALVLYKIQLLHEPVHEHEVMKPLGLT